MWEKLASESPSHNLTIVSKRWKWNLQHFHPGLPVHCLVLFPLYQTTPQPQSRNHTISARNIILGSSIVCTFVLFTCAIAYTTLVCNSLLCVQVFSSIVGKLLEARPSLCLFQCSSVPSIVHRTQPMERGREGGKIWKD